MRKPLIIFCLVSVAFTIVITDIVPLQPTSILETKDLSRSMCWIFQRINRYGKPLNCEKFKVTLEECISRGAPANYDAGANGPYRLKNEKGVKSQLNTPSIEGGFDYLYADANSEIDDQDPPPDVASGKLEDVAKQLAKAVFSDGVKVMNTAVINYYQCKIGGRSKVLKVGTGDSWNNRYTTINGEFGGAIGKIIKLCDEQTAELMMCQVVARGGNIAMKNECRVENIEWSLRRPPNNPWNYREETDYTNYKASTEYAATSNQLKADKAKIKTTIDKGKFVTTKDKEKLAAQTSGENLEATSGGWVTADVDKAVLNCKCNQLTNDALPGLFTVHDLKPCLKAKWDKEACARYKLIKSRGAYKKNDTSPMDKSCP